jgi:hypothetical protein
MVGGVDVGAQRSLVSCSKPVAGSHAAGNSHFQKAQILQLKNKKSVNLGKNIAFPVVRWIKPSLSINQLFLCENNFQIAALRNTFGN